jgi:hypothetical protein
MLFQREPLVLGLDPFIRSPLTPIKNHLDFVIPRFGGRVGEIFNSYFYPDIVAGFIMPNVPHFVGSILLFVAVAFFSLGSFPPRLFGSES